VTSARLPLLAPLAPSLGVMGCCTRLSLVALWLLDSGLFECRRSKPGRFAEGFAGVLAFLIGNAMVSTFSECDSSAILAVLDDFRAVISGLNGVLAALGAFFGDVSSELAFNGKVTFSGDGVGEGWAICDCDNVDLTDFAGDLTGE